MKFTYKQVDSESVEKLGDDFVHKNGNDENGIIPDSEYDRLFDHLAETYRKYGTYSEDSSVDAEFSGYRYVDQIPLIQTVASEDLDPNLAIRAAIEAVSSAHRSLAVGFDMYPEYLLVLSSDAVFGTFDAKWIKHSEQSVSPKSDRAGG